MFPISNELGATQCLVRIAEELRKFKHTVIFAGSGKYMSFIKDNGFDTYTIQELDQEVYIKYIRKGNLNFHTYKSIQSFVSDEVSLINILDPDLIVDIFRPTIYISSKITNVPRVHVANSILTKYYAEKLTIPEGHWAYLITSKSKIIDKMAVSMVPFLKNHMYAKCLIPYNKFLENNNLTPVASFLDLFEGDITILMDAQEFAPIKDYPETVYQVGPILHNKVSETLPPWINKLGKNGEKVIYVSMGSTGDMIQRVLKDLYSLYANENDIQVVSNITYLMDNSEFLNAHNFFIEKFLPAQDIMRKADLVITHGGRGTIYHSLESGVPIIGIPHQPEQEWNLNKVVDLKVGIKILQTKYNKDILKVGIDNILNNKEFRKNALIFKDVLLKYNGAKMSAEIINEKYDKNSKNR